LFCELAWNPVIPAILKTGIQEFQFFYKRIQGLKILKAHGSGFLGFQVIGSSLGIFQVFQVFYQHCPASTSRQILALSFSTIRRLAKIISGWTIKEQIAIENQTKFGG